MIVQERWRSVVGFEGIYQVSNLGRIKRIAGGSGAKIGKIYKPNLHTLGYQQVTLSIHSKQTRFLVHQIVCKAFHGPAKGREPNHKNGIKIDNRASNLEWKTRLENIRHMYDVLRKGAKYWVLVDPKGQTFKIFNLSKFCKDNGLERAGFYTAVSQGCKYKGWNVKKDL